MKRLYLSAAVAALFASPAYFAHCQVLEDIEREYEKRCGFDADADTDTDTDTDTIIICDYWINTSNVVVTASRIGFVDKSRQTVPATILTAPEIQNSGHAYVADLLRTIPGASINRSGPQGGLTQLRLRGSEANHVLVLVDGVEVSNPNTGAFDFASLRSQDVVRIEVLRGEQSALWGSDALGGVVNIITRAGGSNESYRLSIEAGSFASLEGQVSAVVSLGSAALSINGNVSRTDGYDVSGTGGEKDGAESRALNIGLNKVNIGDVTLSAKYSTNYAVSEFDGFNSFTGGLSNAFSETETATQAGRLSVRFEMGGFENLANLALTDTEQTTTGTSFDSQNRGNRTQFNWAAEKTWDVHNLTILGETEKESFSNFGGVGAGQNQNESILNHALGADYRFQKNAITLSASARADFNDRFQDSQTWRVGAGYAFENIGGRVRASVGTGVKNPSMTELFGFTPSDFIGNPNLIPEKSLGYNVGYDQEIGNWKFSADYFHSHLENEIYTIFGQFDPVTFVRLTQDTAANRAFKSNREGLEFGARGSLSNALDFRASMTLLDAQENGLREIRRPKFLASTTATWSPTDIFDVTLTLDHTGKQIDNLSKFDPITFSFSTTRVELDAYTLVGLNIQYDVSDIVTLSLRGENLLDADYQEVVGYASQGRGVYAGISANF